MEEQIVVSEQKDFPLVSPKSRIKLHPFSYCREGEEYIVGSPELSVALSLPPIGIEVMQLFEQGLNVGEVFLRVQDDEDEPYDISDFVQALMECGLVAEIDDQVVKGDVSEKERPEGVEVFRWLRPEYVRWLVSIPVLILDGVIFLTCALLLWYNPKYLPQSKDFFFHPWYTLNTLVVLSTALLFIFLHELGHLCAARAMGINGRLSVGRRLFALVAQCHVDNLWQLPRRQRIIIYLSGMIANLWFFFLSLLVLIWQGSSLSPLLYSWLKLVLILEWTATAWQFQFYMKTDIYFLVSDLFQARNLMDDAEKYLHNVLSRLLPWRNNYHDLSYLPMRERRFVQVYAVFYLLGIVFAVTIFLMYPLPFAVKTIAGTIVVLFQGGAVGFARLADACVALLFYSCNFGLLGWFWWRERLAEQFSKVFKNRFSE